MLGAAVTLTRQAGGGAETFAWGPTTNRVVANLVEQQSPDYFFNGQNSYYCTHNQDGSAKGDTCVHNVPQQCPWSADDRWINGTYGVLNSGTTAFTDCAIADNTCCGDTPTPTGIAGRHLLGLLVTADTPLLIVTVNYQPQNVTWTFTPQLVNGRYEYRGCVVGPTPDGNQLQPIADSNGGWGIEEAITVLTTNPVNHKWQKTLGHVEIGSDSSGAWRSDQCREPRTDPFELSGALWQTAL